MQPPSLLSNTRIVFCRSFNKRSFLSCNILVDRRYLYVKRIVQTSTFGSGIKQMRSTGQIGQFGAKCFQKDFWRYEGSLSEFLRKPRQPVGRRNSDKVATSISELFGHSAFLTLALSFGFQDILSLRLCSLLSGISMAVFNFYHPNGKPLYLPLRWNLLFIFVNTYMIFLILVNWWKSQQLGRYEMKMFEQNFDLTGMNLVDFRTLCLAGELTKMKKGDFLTEQGTLCHHVRVIISGNAVFTVDGQPGSVAGPGNFVSELGLQAGIRFPHQVSTASTIVTSDELICYSWRRGALIDLLESDQSIGAIFQTAISADLVRKLSADLGDKVMSHRDFRMVVQMVVQQEQPTRHRINMVDRYRKIHNISDEELEKTLKELGWTVKKFYGEIGTDKQIHVSKVETSNPNAKSDHAVLILTSLVPPLGPYD